MLEEVHNTHDERSSRLKQENAVLYERLNALEDQLHSVEERYFEYLKNCYIISKCTCLGGKRSIMRRSHVAKS
jgi:hypothetical protein